MINRLLATMVLIGVLCVSAGTAHAGRGVAIYNTGEDVVHLSDVKEEVRAEVEADTAPGVKIGMVFSRFGLFWLDIWRWDKRYVLYDDNNNVWAFPKEQLEPIAAGSLSAPFTMTIPPGLIVIIVLGIGFVLLMVFGKDDDEDEGAGVNPNMPGAPGQPGHPGQPGQPGV